MQKLPLISLFFALALVAAPLAIAEDEVTENLKERLKTAVSGAQVNEIVPTGQLKGYVGTVTDIIQNTIILEDKSGKKSVRVGDDSTLLRTPGSAEIKLESVRIDDSIIAIGDPLGEEEDEIDGKRIIVSENAFTPPAKLSGLGTVKAVNRYSFDLDVPDSDEDLELFYTGKTTYKTQDSTLEFEDIGEGDEILFTAVKDKDGDWSATIVMQIKPAPPSPSPEEATE